MMMIDNWLGVHGISQIDGPSGESFMTKDGRQCTYLVISGREAGTANYAWRVMASRIAEYAALDGISNNRMIAMWGERPQVTPRDFDLWSYRCSLVMLGGGERIA